ncbi:tetraspanin-7-like [Saccoglossus kowalevskii]|uniref:Tetraspanin-7-like n=1 Tax=Saccoglossus kowalevskii TaxID=10224 RepID=A0ABM0M0G1_SACKO|nr:PREDICTED: tetraspanin-7-like [Saccoglossus kowalevskii]
MALSNPYDSSIIQEKMLGDLHICTGIAILSVGIWGKIGLDKYNELSTDDFSNVPYILIGTGGFIIIVGLIGCCATFKSVSWLLRLYGILLFVVLIAELAAGISGLVYREPVSHCNSIYDYYTQ